MSEADKAIVRRVFDEMATQGNLDIAYAIYSPRYIDHQPFPGAPDKGPEGAHTSIGLMRTVCPDLVVTTHEMSAHDGLVACHNTWAGTHLGEVLNIPPTGQPVSFNALVVFRVDQGLIAERWSIGFDQNMRRALGLTFKWSSPRVS
ncbi:SnoaL-like polyketide cyclase [Nocardia tenerifensis]|uniref:SnoaL-like polyketide cyclase n=1 Tax=Nocardia tenerifensis TaxID=228006 RepID=A0A318JMJ8_9NOCA|nr:ester cyclase [Nocardia tenerifensis]PXX55558.1 SnoaL-like polyketide cyclase [Nocardia tenerifensis]